MSSESKEQGAGAEEVRWGKVMLTAVDSSGDLRIAAQFPGLLVLFEFLISSGGGRISAPYQFSWERILNVLAQPHPDYQMGNKEKHTGEGSAHWGSSGFCLGTSLSSQALGSCPTIVLSGLALVLSVA